MWAASAVLIFGTPGSRRRCNMHVRHGRPSDFWQWISNMEKKRKSTVRKKNTQNAGNKNCLSIAGIKIPYWVLGPLIFAIPFVWIATQKTIENFQLSRKGQVATVL